MLEDDIVMLEGEAEDELTDEMLCDDCSVSLSAEEGWFGWYCEKCGRLFCDSCYGNCGHEDNGGWLQQDDE